MNSTNPSTVLPFEDFQGERPFESGVFLVDKPVGPSSFRLVQLVRRALSLRKVGHAGTLDPFASGLMIICAGRPATRLIPRFMTGRKSYQATVRLGIETSTQDLEGEVVARQTVPPFTRDELERCLAGFTGERMQVPPSYSALKHQGKPLYHYARKGIMIEKAARPINIFRLELLEHGADGLRFAVDCSKGTYIRTLAADIGRALGCGGHLTDLRRLASGPFTLDGAIDGGLLYDLVTARRELAARRLSVEEVLVRLEAQAP